MGRIPRLDKSKFVKYNKQTNTSMCLQCQKLLSGLKLGNIKRHYWKVHNIILEHHPAKKSERSIKRTLPKVELKLSKEEFIECCVGLIALENVPFEIFDDEQYFQRIIQPYSEAFSLNMNSKSIVEHLHNCTDDIKQQLKEILDAKMLSLKFDVIDCVGKILLGIGIQYISNFKIVNYTIGIIQLERKYSLDYLKKEISKCLNEYEIDRTQIYAFSSDDGANEISDMKFLLEDGDALKFEATEYVLCTDMDTNDKLMSQDTEGIRSNGNVSSDENESHHTEDNISELYDHLESILPVARCAAHAVEFVARDIFLSMGTYLNECRRLAKRLRIEMKNDEHNHQITLPPEHFDITRCCSTFAIMEFLLHSKEYVFLNRIENDVNWTFIEVFVSGFSPLMELSKRLQAKQYLFGDFYRDWLACEVKLKKKDNKYAVQLVLIMQKQKEKLLENIVFLAALYFDPRFNFLDTPYLNDEQRQKAVDHILKTYESLNSLNGLSNSLAEDAEDCSSTSSHMDSESADDPYGDLEREFNLSKSNQTSQTELTIRQKLEKLAFYERKPFATDILEYWKCSASVDRDIIALIEVILAVPSSQDTDERTFSALATIADKQRAELSSESINDLLLLKLNPDLIRKRNRI